MMKAIVVATKEPALFCDSEKITIFVKKCRYMRRYIIALFFGLLCSTTSIAREVRSLNENWYFYPSTARSTDGALRVNLPHTWSSRSRGGGVNSSIGNFVRKITFPAEWQFQRLFIKFYGVNNSANLLINGVHVGEHHGAYTAFTFEITDHILWGKENELQLVVDGAQTSWLPPTSYDHYAEYGVHRPVELIVTPQAAISPTYHGSDGLFVTTSELASNRVKGDVAVKISTRTNEPMAARLSIFSEDGDRVFKTEVLNIAADDNNDQVSIPFEFSNPKRWSPSTPSLYRFAVELATPSSSDMVEVWSGLRIVDISDDGKVTINGQKINMKGVLLYHDHPLVGTSIGQKELAHDISFVVEMGANAIRSAISPHPQALYDICDKEGLMAWIDFPLCSTTYLADIAYLPTPEFHRNAATLAHEIVVQNYNHPSVIMWGLFSQTKNYGEQFTQLLQEITNSTRETDPTRLIVAASNHNGDLNSIPDLISWRQSLGWNRGNVTDISLWSSHIHTKWSNFKSSVTYGEGGSIRHQNMGRTRNDYAAQDNMHTIQLFDRTQPDWFPESGNTRLHETYSQSLLSDTRFWGVWLCSMFDYRTQRNSNGENSNGMVTFYRDQRKDVFYLYRSQWNKKVPTLHISGRREWRRGKTISDLTIYCSTDDVPVVTLNGGAKLAVKTDGGGIWKVAPFDLLPGQNTVEAKQGRLVDKVVFTYEPTL